MIALSGLWNSIQSWLFPALEYELGELTAKQQEFVRVCELCHLEKHIVPYRWRGKGRPPECRLAIAKSFVAKSIYNKTTTKGLIEFVKSSPAIRRLCGWESVGDIPSESTFSRAFFSFAEGDFPQRIHESIIKSIASQRLLAILAEILQPLKDEKRERRERRNPKQLAPGENAGAPRKEKFVLNRKRRRFNFKLHVA